MNAYPGEIELFVSTRKESEEIWDFYDDAVGARVHVLDASAVRNLASDGLYTLARIDGELVGASALCPLADGKSIGCIAGRKKKIKEQGRIVELLNVLKQGPNSVPSGIWNELLFSLPVVNAFDKADYPLGFDILVTNVPARMTNTVNCIVGAKSADSPLRFEIIDAANALTRNLTPTNMPAKTAAPFRCPVSNVFAVTERLLSYAEREYIPSKGKTIPANFEGLGGVLDLMHDVVQHKDWFQATPSDTSWKEARGMFYPLQQSLRPAKSDDGFRSRFAMTCERD
jgi:hypothetical protein